MAKASKVQNAELAAASAEMVSDITRVKADFTQRIIYLIDTIDEDMAFEFMVKLNIMDQSKGRIRIVLMSCGGSEPAGWAIYDAIQEARSEIWVDGYGAVWSMAALILQAGSVRRMSRSCRYMLHAGSMKVGAADQRNIIAAGIECQQQNKNYITAISKRSGLSFQDVWKLWNNETYLMADECRKRGLIDAIVPYSQEKTK